MEFEQNKYEKISTKFGYIFSYILFTTMLYFILILLNKLPKNWNYINIATITFIVSLVAVIIKKLLK